MHAKTSVTSHKGEVDISTEVVGIVLIFSCQQQIHAFWSIRDLDRRDNPERFGKNKGWLTLKHFQLRDGSILV